MLGRRLLLAAGSVAASADTGGCEGVRGDSFSFRAVLFTAKRMTPTISATMAKTAGNSSKKSTRQLYARSVAGLSRYFHRPRSSSISSFVSR